MSTREEFETAYPVKRSWIKWDEKTGGYLPSNPDFVLPVAEAEEMNMKLKAWQAATSSTAAKYELRIKELEEACKSVYWTDEGRIEADTPAITKALSTTSLDQALQRAVLEARIDECNRAYSSFDDGVRVKELCKQLTMLEGE